MTTDTSTLRQVRVLLTAIMLFLASTLFAANGAVAGTLIPMEDMGAPGGGGGGAEVVDETANSDIPGVRQF
jgi:hypothetical protein